ncbi:DUF2975 domain-containing protein [uncultured Acetobacteroides sp.]|uniref:DUF2975 domain-containing protein n=1 Tax=uncultured Acetobacteroides sp. TaxID=1760811 RepID=UPI0029F58F51|nr:DUF2975 domain-containing protein [uncultured Acetobacteroides sp.]
MDKNLLIRVRVLNVAIALLLIFSFSDNFIRLFNDTSYSDKAYEKQNVSGDYYFVSLRPTADFQEFPASTNNSSKVFVTISNASITLYNSPTSTVRIILDIVMSVTALAILVWLIILIWKITNSLSRGEVLTRNNIIRIRTIGLLLIAKGVIAIASQYVYLYYLKSIVTINGYEMVANISYTKTIVGLMLLVFAEVLVVANRIREEQELTI